MMRDCSNATMRERLPDLLHDRLPDALRAEVHAHLNTCADCRAELALLERVRAAAFTPKVDSSRIVSALPAYRAPSPWQRMFASPILRVAAVLALLAGSALLVIDRPARIDDPAVTPPVVSVPPVQAPVADTPIVPDRRPAPRSAPTELAMAEMFDDLTDAELKALLDALGTLEAVTPVETEVVVPAVNREGA